jgi:hypothetical protein
MKLNKFKFIRVLKKKYLQYVSLICVIFLKMFLIKMIGVLYIILINTILILIDNSRT